LYVDYSFFEALLPDALLFGGVGLHLVKIFFHELVEFYLFIKLEPSELLLED